MAATAEKLPVFRMAFSGVAQAGRKFWVFPIWVAVYTGVALLYYFLLLLAAQDGTLDSAKAVAQSVASGADWRVRDFVQVGFFASTYFGLLMLALAIMPCAAARMALNPDRVRTAYLATGADERRVGFGYLMLILVTYATIVAAVLVAIVIPIAVTGNSQATDANTAVSIALAVSAVLFLLYALSRVSLAIPVAIDQKRFGLRTSWRMTREARLRVFAVWVISILVSIAAIFLVGIAGFFVLQALDPALANQVALENPVSHLSEAAQNLGRTDIDRENDFRGMLQEPMLVYLLFSALITSLFYVITVTPIVRIYEHFGARAVPAAAG